MFRKVKTPNFRKDIYKNLEFPFNLYALLLNQYGEVRYMHYGYWEDSSELSINEAQERLAEMLYEKIPIGVSRVLDVGCGLGTTVYELLKRGYDAIGISPDAGLINYAKEKYPELIDRLHIVKFEDYDASERFDLLFFCESAQYIKDKEKLFRRVNTLLKPGGYVLICDEFLRKPSNKASFHAISDFLNTATVQGFEILDIEDITQKVVRTRHFFSEAWNMHGSNLQKLFAEDRLTAFLKSWETHSKMFEDGEISYYTIVMKLKDSL